MDEKIDLAEVFLYLLHQGGNLCVIADIARERLGPRQRGGQLFDILLQPFILIIKKQLGTLSGSRLGNGPGDAVFISHTDDEPFFSVEQHGHNSPSLSKLYSVIQVVPRLVLAFTQRHVQPASTRACLGRFPALQACLNGET